MVLARSTVPKVTFLSSIMEKVLERTLLFHLWQGDVYR